MWGVFSAYLILTWKFVLLRFRIGLYIEGLLLYFDSACSLSFLVTTCQSYLTANRQSPLIGGSALHRTLNIWRKKNSSKSRRRIVWRQRTKCKHPRKDCHFVQITQRQRRRRDILAMCISNATLRYANQWNCCCEQSDPSFSQTHHQKPDERTKLCVYVSVSVSWANADLCVHRECDANIAAVRLSRAFHRNRLAAFGNRIKHITSSWRLFDFACNRWLTAWLRRHDNPNPHIQADKERETGWRGYCVYITRAQCLLSLSISLLIRHTHIESGSDLYWGWCSLEHYKNKYFSLFSPLYHEDIHSRTHTNAIRWVTNCWLLTDFIMLLYKVGRDYNFTK